MGILFFFMLTDLLEKVRTHLEKKDFYLYLLLCQKKLEVMSKEYRIILSCLAHSITFGYRFLLLNVISFLGQSYIAVSS